MPTNMKSRPPSATWLAYLLALVTPFFCSGCFYLYGHRDTKIRVFDAETGEPIVGADVHIIPLGVFSLNTPKPQSLQTQTGGTATTRVTTYPFQWLNAEAEGYIDYQGDVPKVSSRNTLPGFYYPKGTGDPPRLQPEIHIPLYREGSPTITLVAPAGYRGPIKIFWSAVEHNDRRFTPGQRDFRYAIDEYGDVAIAAPPLFMRDLYNIGIRVVTASGEVFEDTSDRYDAAIADPRKTLLRRVDHRESFNNRMIRSVVHHADSLLVLGTPDDSDYFYRQVNHVTRDEYGGTHIAYDPEGWERVMQRARRMEPR